MRGSITQYKGKRGTAWRIVVDLGKGIDGKRRQKRLTVRGSRKEAERRLAELIAEIERGTYVDSGRMTVGEYLNKWLEHKAADLAPRTLASYRMIVEKHLIPALGSIKLADLRPLHIQEYYQKALKEGRKDGKVRSKGKGLSPTTVLYHHRVLHEALGQAVKWQLLPQNPAEAVTPPRKEKKEIAVLNEEQARTLLEAVKGTVFYIPTLLALYAGLRRGEVLGLRWQDVDLKNGSIQIRQTLQWGEGRELGFYPPKTHRSRRSVAIPPVVVSALKEHKKLQAEWRLKAGSAWADNGLVVCNYDGTPLNPDTFSSRFRDLTEELFGTPVGFHALRHTCASFLLALGCHPKVVAEQLGHSTTNLTLDTYSHVVPRLQSGAVEKLQEYLEKTM